MTYGKPKAFRLTGVLCTMVAWQVSALAIYGQGRPEALPTTYECGVMGEYGGATSLREGGERSLFRAGLDVARASSWWGWRAKPSARVEWLRPNWDGAVPQALQGAEANVLLEERLGVTMAKWWPSRRGWMLWGDVGVAGVPEASVQRATSVGMMGQYLWPLTEQFSVNVGAMARTRLSDDPLVLPLAGFMWSPVAAVQVGTEGPGIIMRVKVREGVRLTGGARWDSRDYRLAEEDQPTEGVVRWERIIAEAAWDWQTWDRFEWRVAVGVTTRERWEVTDADGERVIRVAARPAPMVAAGCRWRF